MGKVTRKWPNGNVVEPRQTRILANDSVAPLRARGQSARAAQRDTATSPARRAAGKLPTPKHRHQSMTAQEADPLDNRTSSSKEGKGKGASIRAAASRKNTSTHDRASAQQNAPARPVRRPYARMSAPDRPHIRTNARKWNVDGSDAEDEESGEGLEDDDSKKVKLNPDLFDLNNYASHTSAVVAYLRISPTDPVHYQAYVNNTDFLIEPPTREVTVTAAQRAYYQDQAGRQFSQQRLLNSTIVTEERGVTVRDVVILLNQKHESEDGVTLRRVKTMLGANTYIEIPGVVVKN